MIPKIIHYCWFGGKPLPGDVQKCISTWKKMCPDYEIKQWNESNVDVNSHPFLKTAYEAKAWAFASDYVRLKVVYDNGGIYLDTDVELLKNLDFLRRQKCYIGVQQTGHLCTTGLGFGAERYNPVVQTMLEKYDGLEYSDAIKMEIACPYLNNAVIAGLGYIYSEKPTEVGGILVLPPKYLDPIAPGQSILRCDETISIHHYSASWMSGKAKMKRKLVQLLGQERMMKLKWWLRHERKSE